jgi:hypothetical protein
MCVKHDRRVENSMTCEIYIGKHVTIRLNVMIRLLTRIVDLWSPNHQRIHGLSKECINEMIFLRSKTTLPKDIPKCRFSIKNDVSPFSRLLKNRPIKRATLRSWYSKVRSRTCVRGKWWQSNIKMDVLDTFHSERLIEKCADNTRHRCVVRTP